MTLVIVAQGGGAYVARMPAALLRLMMLVALAFMPLGMTGTPAVASTTSGAAAGHCDEHQKPADAPAKMSMQSRSNPRRLKGIRRRERRTTRSPLRTTFASSKTASSAR